MEVTAHRGSVALSAALILLLGGLLLAVSLEVYHVYSVAERVREKTDEAVLSVAAVNVGEFYGGARESDGNARHPVGGGFSSTVLTDAVLEDLAAALGGVKGTNSILDEGSYEIRDLQTVYENTDGEILHFQTTLTLRVELSLGGQLLPYVTLPLTVRSDYAAKF